MSSFTIFTAQQNCCCCCEISSYIATPEKSQDFQNAYHLHILWCTCIHDSQYHWYSQNWSDYQSWFNQLTVHFFTAIMAGRYLRASILDLLRVSKIQSSQLRRRCNDNWCSELRYLPETSLLKRLKYVLWWSPLRSIVTAYNRGMLKGYRVLTCAFEELQRRNLVNVPCIRKLVSEINGKLYLIYRMSQKASRILQLLLFFRADFYLPINKTSYYR